MAGFCEHGNEYSGSIEGRVFLDQLSNYNIWRDTLYNGANF
jgi:hypothetical protein